jgi:acyl carrier protein
MNDLPTIELKNIDSEDIDDVLRKVEKSFGFKFGDTELKDVKTFGELCDIITGKVQGDNASDCTSQQGFYKLRSAIAVTQNISKESITPDTNLEHLFPRHDRIKKVKELKKELGMPINIMTIKSWLRWTIFIGIVASLIMFFFEWEFALIGLVTFLTISWISYNFFATEFQLATVGQLTEKITRENYLQSRRNGSTANRNEIAQKVKEIFQHDLDLESSALTKEATFK